MAVSCLLNSLKLINKNWPIAYQLPIISLFLFNYLPEMALKQHVRRIGHDKGSGQGAAHDDSTVFKTQRTLVVGKGYGQKLLNSNN